MHSHPDIIFKLCVVNANETELRQATTKAWQMYAVANVHADPRTWTLSARSADVHRSSPFESEGAGADADDPRLWFRVRANALFYANNFASDISDPYDREGIIDRLKFIYSNKMKPVIEYELGAKIGIVEGMA
jgi:hypothetical protein